MNSDEIAKELAPYGRLSVFQSKYDKTFSADLELYVNGMNAQVESGFRHATMKDAMMALYSNVMNIVVKAQGDTLLPSCKG